MIRLIYDLVSAYFNHLLLKKKKHLTCVLLHVMVCFMLFNPCKYFKTFFKLYIFSKYHLIFVSSISKSSVGTFFVFLLKKHHSSQGPIREVLNDSAPHRSPHEIQPPLFLADKVRWGLYLEATVFLLLQVFDVTVAYYFVVCNALTTNKNFLLCETRGVKCFPFHIWSKSIRNSYFKVGFCVTGALFLMRFLCDAFIR